MIACCGLDCAECDALLATQADDDVQRAAVAAKWTQWFGHPFTAAEINCEGCRGDGLKVAYCGMCTIRKCCMDKGHATCAGCGDYPCEDLDGMFKAGSEPRENLDALRG